MYDCTHFETCSMNQTHSAWLKSAMLRLSVSLLFVDVSRWPFPPPVLCWLPFLFDREKPVGGEHAEVSQPKLLLKFCLWKRLCWMPCGAASQRAQQHPHLVFIHLYMKGRLYICLLLHAPLCMWCSLKHLYSSLYFEYRLSEVWRGLSAASCAL